MSTMALFKGILNTIGYFLFFSMPHDEPPQGQSNRALLVLMKSIEYQIQERIAAFPITEDTLLDWNTALMINAARRTDVITTGTEYLLSDWNGTSFWLDEEGNPAPYNDGIVAEYPKM